MRSKRESLFRIAYHSFQTVTKEPVSIDYIVWRPAIKKRDREHRVISREILSPQEAKRSYAFEKRGVDPWGHVAARLSLDGARMQNAEGYGIN